MGVPVERTRRFRLRPGDRVEIYRPLIADPREARRQRASKPADGPGGST